MQSKMLLAILFSFSLLSCKSLPEKPKGELCAPVCGGMAQCSEIRNPDNEYEIPNELLTVCVTSETWKNIQDYIEALKKKARENCTQQP